MMMMIGLYDLWCATISMLFRSYAVQKRTVSLQLALAIGLKLKFESKILRKSLEVESRFCWFSRSRKLNFLTPQNWILRLRIQIAKSYGVRWWGWMLCYGIRVELYSSDLFVLGIWTLLNWVTHYCHMIMIDHNYSVLALYSIINKCTCNVCAY